MEGLAARLKTETDVSTDMPDFKGFLSGTNRRPYEAPISAKEIHNISDIRKIVGDDEKVTSIDFFVEKEMKDPNNGQFPEPSLLIQKYSLYINIETESTSHNLALDHAIIKLYLTKKFCDDIYMEGTEGKKMSTRDIRNPVKDDKHKPTDVYHQIKINRVLADYVIRTMVALGERSLKKYRMHVFEKGRLPHAVDISMQAISTAYEASEIIGFSPVQHTSQEILDLRNL